MAWLFLLGVILSEGAPIAFVLAGRRIWFLQNLGFFAGPSGTALAWTLAAATAALFIAASVKSNRYIAQHWREIPLMKSVAILMALISGIFEEAFFRRFLMDTAMHRGWNPLAQILLSAAIFGAAHAIWGIFARDFRPALTAGAATGILGALLAWVYVIGGRSLAPCIAAHVAINLVLEPWLILSAASGHWNAARAD
jgi:membrane protease YdiL (CAAX protease family)